MWKRVLAAALCLALTLAPLCAQAEGSKPSDEFFDRGRRALALISYGEMDRALDELNFTFGAESGFSEDGFRDFIRNSFTMLGRGQVQLEVALCWQDAAGWHLGIPLAEPVSEDVEVLVLDSRDLVGFSGYAASTWSALEQAADDAKKAYWNIAYDPGDTVLYTDR